VDYSNHLSKLSIVLNDNYSQWQPNFGQLPLTSPSSLASYIDSPSPIAQWSGNTTRVADISPHLSSGIKGRKLTQITNFIAAIADSFKENSSSTLFDYCCGKAHLSRIASQVTSVSAIHGIEFEGNLVNQARALCEKLSIPHNINCGDALDRNYTFPKNGHVLAMHACGELHTTLLEEAVIQKHAYISLSPCCYHKRFRNPYRPLSTQGKAAQLQLTSENIKLAVRGATTSSQGERKAFHQLRTLRLVFDSYCREYLAHADYTPLPSLPQSSARLNIQDFIALGCELKGLPLLLLSSEDYAQLQSSAEVRYQHELQQELVAQQFQPLLEEWIVLDLALYLEENNYSVEVTRFCDIATTPRNYLIKARYNSK